MQRWIVCLVFLGCIVFSPLGYCQTNRPTVVDNSAKGFDYAKGFQDGLQEHRAMLEEARQELHSLERQDTSITHVFYFLTALFTLVSACNAWSYISSKRSVEKARDEAQQITQVRAAILSELPNHLKEHLWILREATLSSDTITPQISAKIAEIDHMTFLANPLFKFLQPHSRDELRIYRQALLITARWYIAESRPAEALIRLEKFFEYGTTESTESSSDRRDLAMAHIFQAMAHHRLLADLKKERIQNAEKTRDEKGHCASIESNLKMAQHFDPTLSYTYWLKAVYLSKDSADGDGQSRAIEIYDSLIDRSSDRSKDPDITSIALQNKACCLKRQCDGNGDYWPLFRTLETMPSEQELKTQYADDLSENVQNIYLWRRIATDSTFFQSVKGDPKEYAKCWSELLTKKMNVTPNWKQFCHEIAHAPGCAGCPQVIQSWQIRLW